MVQQLSGPEIAPRSGTVKHLVIFLHGLGSNGDDLISLAPELRDELPDTHFISPNAPFQFDMAPFGYQWFSLVDRDPARILPEMRIAAEPLNAFIDAQRDRFKLADADIALVGFSQGSMMSMFTAIRRPAPIAGIVAFSGLLRAQEAVASDITARPPVCLIHGDSDEVVPFAAMASTEATLRAANIAVSAHARPYLGHGIDLEGIEIATKFLREKFGLV